MTRIGRSVALALWLGFAAAGTRADSLPEPRYGPCRTEHVIDGNTVDLRCGAEGLRVRLVNLSSPKEGDTGYSEATRALRALLRARDLYLAFATPGQPTLDRDGLLLVHLYDRAGQNLNVALVSLGWAAYTPPVGADPHALQFTTAEREARTEQRAMWTVWAYTVGRGDPGDASDR